MDRNLIDVKKTILCPNCKTIIPKTEKINPKDFDEYYDLTNLNCPSCDLEFVFILCEHCKQRIFFKKNSTNLELNGLNGFNIKCPYSNCSKFFYLTKCPKCKKNQKLNRFIEEGELIKCKHSDCNFEYYQVRCPIKNCLENYCFAKPKHFNNNPNGIMFNHKNEIIYQKINCAFCTNPIVYLSTQKNIDRYYEAQVITCPYENCKKSFNRLICPDCSNIIIVKNALYEMGHKITCNKCGKIFAKLLCSKCFKINTMNTAFFKGGVVKCRYKNCAKESNIITCLFCQRINIFKRLPIPGQIIKCGYSDCKNYFNYVPCPSCNGRNFFENNNFFFGHSYKCIYPNCKKNFQFFICPNCLSFSRTLEKTEGRKLKCNKCEEVFINWGCPFCKHCIMDKNSTFEIGQKVKCPKCEIIYNFSRCVDCHKLIFPDENNNYENDLMGISVKCKCGKYSATVICPFCKSRNVYADKMENFQIGEKINCSNCHKIFEFSRNNTEIYNGNLSYLKSVKGTPVNFGTAKVDENFLLFKDLFIDTDLYRGNNMEVEEKKEFQDLQEKQFCLVCHSSKKQSVFCPCGHRCSCYECALKLSKIMGKCPKCWENCTNIIEKVYD